MLDVSKIRKDFPMLQNSKTEEANLIYFDNAATTFKPQTVVDAINRYNSKKTTNIHRGDYALSYQISEEYEKARLTVAKFINADAKEIVFTSGATASLNLVAFGYGRKFLKQGDVILMSVAEHASNILPWFTTAKAVGAIIEYIQLTDEGELTISNFRKAMHDGVKVVSVSHVTNVMGFIAPIKQMAKIAHQFKAIICVDGAQSVPHIMTNVKEWDIDFLSFSAHKMCGPTGVGVLFGKYRLLEEMDALHLGGGSNARFDIAGNILLKNPPVKFEAGTPAIDAVLGLQKAIDYLDGIGMEEIEKYEHSLRIYFMEQLVKLPNFHIYNPHAPTGIITFNVEKIFAQDVAVFLSSKGIAVRAGDHCAKLLVNLLGVSDTVRASINFYNTKNEIDCFIEACKEITLEKCIDLYL